MRRFWCRVAVHVAVGLGTAGHAMAAPSTEAQDTARQTYQSGAQAYAEGRYKDAIDLFLEAARIAPNPAFSYNIGLTYEQLGDPENALRWYRDYLRDLPNAPDRGDIEPRIREAERKLRERGVQQVSILSKPDGATVTVDGKALGITPWTGQLGPGRHKLVLNLDNYAESERTFELPSDHAIDVSATLVEKGQVHAVQPERAPVAAPADEPPPPVSSGARVRPLTWVAFGLGAAGLGTALGLELARAGAVDSARQAPTNVAGKEDYDRATSLETPARIAAGVGAAFAIAGGVLLYLDLTTKTGNSAATVGCAPAFCGATYVMKY